MAYTPDPQDATQPTEDVKGIFAAAEFRAIKAYIQQIVAGTLPPVSEASGIPVRQTVLTGPRTSASVPDLLAAGTTNLTVKLKATSNDPAVVTWANGFDAAGAKNLFQQYATDQDNFWTLPANAKSYLFLKKNVANLTANATAYSSLSPMYYGEKFPRELKACLNFEGSDGSTSIIDDYGNTWTASGNAQLDTAQFKFGTSSLLLDGTGDYISSTEVVAFKEEVSTVECWIRFNALPASGTHQWICTQAASGGSGFRAKIENVAGTTRINIFMDDDSGSVISATTNYGVKTAWAINTWYHFEFTFDPVAQKYFWYIDGVKDGETGVVATRIKVSDISGGLNFGRYAQSGSDMFNGWIDGVEVSDYCKHPNGVTFTPPAVAPSVSGLFFDTTKFKSYEVTGASTVAGTPATLTAAAILSVGEATTNATVATPITYAYQGKFESNNIPVTLSSNLEISHNLGLPIRCYTVDGILTTISSLAYYPWSPQSNLDANIGYNNYAAAYRSTDRLKYYIRMGSTLSINSVDAKTGTQIQFSSAVISLKFSRSW